MRAIICTVLAIIVLLLLQIACVPFALATVKGTNAQEIEITTRTITLPAGYIYYKNINAAYKVHLKKLDWEVAKARCISEGGRLAVVDTLAKLRYVKAQESTNNYVWVGIIQKKGKWVAVDTRSCQSDLPWGLKQPSGKGACAAVQKNGKRLHNIPCDRKLSFICEIPIVTTIYAIPCHCE